MNEDVGKSAVVASSRVLADQTRCEGCGRCGEEGEGGMEAVAYMKDTEREG